MVDGITNGNPASLAESRTKSPRQARARQKIAYILEATAQLLSRDDSRSFTTNQIAERAGVSIGTLYRYFRNKHDLSKQLFFDEATQKLCDAEKTLNDDNIISADELLQCLVDTFTDIFDGRPIVRNRLNFMLSGERDFFEEISRRQIQFIAKLEARLMEMDPDRFRGLEGEEREFLLLSWKAIVDRAIVDDPEHVKTQQLKRLLLGMATTYLER